MQKYFYKSEAPDVVAIVQEFYQAKDLLNERLGELGKLFGGAIAPMRDITSHFAGGVKLSASRELDVHWCRPDDHGYRSLRCKAVPPKGITKEQRAAIRAEHERLLNLWKEHCPKRLDSHSYWERLNINTGNLLLCGGIKFEHQGVAYFCLGFEAAHGPDGVRPSGQQLYAKIKKSSEYAHQSDKLFPVRVTSAPYNDYVVLGGPGGVYRLRDVSFYVIEDGRKYRLN